MPNFPKFTRTRLLLTLTTITLLASCAEQASDQQASTDAPEIVPRFAPDGLTQLGSQWQPRGPLPMENLTVSGAVSRGTVVPTIIDTTTFPEQFQLSVPGDELLSGSKIMPPPGAREPDPVDFPALRDAERSGRVGDVRSGTTVQLQRGWNAISATAWTPPDPTLAVGPNHVVVTVNQDVAFYTKSGNLQFAAPLNFFGSPGFFEDVGAQGFTFDPKCFYDHYSGRYAIVALEVYGRDTGTTNDDEATITFAVSDDSNPNGVWYKYRTNAILSVGANTYWWDYPGFGFDEDAIYVTGNLFGLSGGSTAGAAFRVFDKTPLLTGAPATFSTLRDGSLWSVQCAQHYGSNGAAFFAGIPGSGAITVTAMVNPLTAPALTSTALPVAGFSQPVSSETPGGNFVSAVDRRLFNVMWRDGSLYTAHNITKSGATTENRARWYEFDLNNWPFSGSPNVDQTGEISRFGSDIFFPAIAANGDGQVALVVAGSSPTENITMEVAVREPTDSAGDIGPLEEVTQGTVSSSGRWGDYYDITVDPTDDTTFWAVGQYSTSSGWRTYVQEFIAGPPLPGPDPFGLTSPADATVGVDPDAVLLFQWEESPNADSYQITVATDPALTQTVIGPISRTTESLLVFGGTFDESTTYYWGVTAINGSGLTSSTPASASFTTLGPPAECPGDITGDDVVDLADFTVLASNFGGGPGLMRSEGDLTGDGFVDLADFTELASNFGLDCSAL